MFEESVRGRKVTKGLALNFGQVVQIYADQVAMERLSDATKEFRLRPASTFQRTWPRLWETDVRRITEDDCLNWQRRFENGGSEYLPNRAKRKTVKGDSPTVVNACIAFLHRVFAIAIKQGLIGEDPSRSMKRKRPTKKKLIVPSSAQFHQIVAHVRQSRSRWAVACSELIEGLAYTGMRIEESQRLEWVDLNFENMTMLIKGSKTENSYRYIPIIPQMQELLSRIERKGPKVFAAKTALTSLKKACAAVGVQEMTHHDLRHYFATSMIESGVDIPTLSVWLGHSDGGVLCMKTYGHIRALHSAKMAAKMRV